MQSCLDAVVLERHLRQQRPRARIRETCDPLSRLKSDQSIEARASVPEFGDEGWQHTQTQIEKRDRLMHPKNAEDLEVPDALWADIHEGTKWIFRQLFSFMEQLAIVHGPSSGR